MKRLVSVVVALALLGAFGGTFYYLYRKSEKPPVVFETEQPFIATIVKKTVATGSIVPRREVAIKPQVSGILEELMVEPGASVARGDLIARVAIVPNMVTLNDAESRLSRARIAMDNARRDLERNRQLRTEGAIAEAVLQQFQMAHDTGREELASALENLELIRKGTTTKSGAITNTLVRATIDGMVLEVPLEVGASVIEANTFNEGTTIATIADMSELIFKGKVDESEVGKLKPGMELVMTIGAIDGEKFKAELEHIAPKGLEEDGAIQFEIRAALAKADRDGLFIRANLSANADIVLDRRDDVLAINESLLAFDAGAAYVEVETAPQQFERRAIVTGLSDGIVIEVVSGLVATDRVKNAAKAALKN